MYHFQRKPRAIGNFSLEFVFQDVRQRLSDRILFTVIIANELSNGVIRRIKNIFQAYRSQGPVNHITGDIHYIALLMKKNKTILTIHDCGFMVTKNPLKRWALKWFWLKIPVWKSKYVTSVSTKTKEDIIRYTRCKDSKIKVIPVAVSDYYVPVPKQFNAAYPVLLQIGTAPNKNLARVITAIAGLKCKFVIVGEISTEHKKLLEEFHIDYINEYNISADRMRQHYIDCDIVVYASTLEGFGMPIIEANCVERVVIAGNNSSMPEVGSTAACYVDALSVNAIREGIERVIRDDQYRNELIANGRTNKLRFNGDRIAEMYFDLYQQVSRKAI